MRYGCSENRESIAERVRVLEAAERVAFGGGADAMLAFAPIGRALLGSGSDMLRAADEIAWLGNGAGDDTVTLTAPSTAVYLGAGNDVLDAAAPVGNVVAGRGDDTVTLGDGADRVLLGPGDDRLVAEGHVECIEAGSGNDHVVVEGTAGAVRLGAGDDFLYVADHVARVEGGSGQDTLAFAAGLSDFDFAFSDGASGEHVTLVHRLTGAETEVSGIEQFVFADSEHDAGSIAARFVTPSGGPAVTVTGGTQAILVNNPDPTEVVLWNRAALEAVIEIGTVGPTPASRAYALLNTAIYDAWATYAPEAVRVSFDHDGDDALLAAAAAGDPDVAKAISYAAHAVLTELFPSQAAIFDTLLETRLGHAVAGDGSVAWQVGTDAAEGLMSARRGDGANQLGGYADTSGYQPVNPHPLEINDIARWTPESRPIDPEDDAPEQGFLTPHWAGVESFALPEGPDGATVFDDIRPDAPVPFFAEAYAGSILNFAEATITLDAALELDGESFAAGDTVPVSQALIGSVIDQAFIDQAMELVEISANLTDPQKVSAEFYEDGPNTGFPPGSWVSFAEYVSARDFHTLDEDVAMFFMVGNAVFDAGVATWEAKVHYDYARPVRVIRDLGELELIGVPGIDEVTGEAGHVIEAWGGRDPMTGEDLGTRTILAENFKTYQNPDGDPSPPFAEHTSGHSAFSKAAATALTLYTGSEAFGAGVVFAPGSAQFVDGVPSEEVTFLWETFDDAALAAGQSRLYGQIHFAAGNEGGLALGEEVGERVYELAQSFLDGSATDADRPFSEDFII